MIAAAALVMITTAFSPLGDQPSTGASRPRDPSGRLVVEMSLPAGAVVNTELNSVSCAHPTFCMAVGEFRPDGRFMQDQGEHPVVLRYDGRRWSKMPSPAAVGTELNGVSCVSKSACVAVGERVSEEGDSSPFIEEMKGTRWSVVSPASPAIFKVNANHLESVSCISAGKCVAVGWDDGVGYGRALNPVTALIARKGPTGWTVNPVAPLVPTPQGPSAGSVVVPISRNPAYLMSVSCTSMLCVATGEGASFAERQGTWSPLDTSPLVLNGVTCSLAATCVGVGRDGQGLSGAVVVTVSTAAATLSGRRWQRVPSPNTPSASNALNAVSCWAARSCVAVGAAIGSPQEQPNNREEAALIEVEAMGRWLLAKPPTTPIKVDVSLSSVSCPSPRVCIAVGQSAEKALHVPSGPIHAVAVRVKL